MIYHLISDELILCRQLVLIARELALQGGVPVWHTNQLKPIAPSYVMQSVMHKLGPNQLYNLLQVAYSNIGIVLAKPAECLELKRELMQACLALGRKPGSIWYKGEVLALYSPRAGYRGFAKAMHTNSNLELHTWTTEVKP